MNHDKTVTVLGFIAGFMAIFGEAITNVMQSLPAGPIKVRNIVLGLALYFMAHYSKGIAKKGG